MNIAKDIIFNVEKPCVLPIRKTETTNIFAVGLVKNQILQKHKTQWPTLLIVLRGSILFRMNSETITLNVMDTYQIPTDIEHDVTGTDIENIFLITKLKEGK